MRQRSDLGSIFFLILVIGGAAYLFLSWGDSSIKSGRCVEAARDWSKKIDKTGKQLDTVISLLRHIPPMSLGTITADLVCGRPGQLFTKAQVSYNTAKSGVASLHYYAMQYANIEEQLAQAEAKRSPQAYTGNILKRLGEARKSYDQAAGEISQALRGATDSVRRAALISTGTTTFLILFGGAAVYLSLAVTPYFRKNKDGALELQVRDKDMATTVRLRRADPEGLPLYRLLQEKGLLSGTTNALLGILAAYPEHPASIEGHSPASLGLLQHTENTMTRVIQNLPENMDAKAAVTTALAHDIGKTLAYQKGDDGQWFSTGLYHDRLSATILSCLPDFHQEFTGEVKTGVLAAVRYHHSPLDMPMNIPELSRRLASLLQEGDSNAAREEKREAAESIAPYVYSTFRKMVTELNVNGYNGGPPQGYTLSNVPGKIALVYEHALREGIIAHLPARLKEGVSGERSQGRVHPAWPVIARALTEKNVILSRIDEIDADCNGFFDLEITMPAADPIIHSCLVAINSEAVPESTWQGWAASPAPTLEVKRSACA
ncbi:MAG TPA: HD domain-containing protein [Proteobacteria bacterium]|nr:HD domain-containing protein [Pseudomonadota bacterium]